MKRCTKCVLPETYPEIVFDSNGICNQCHSYQPVEYKGDAALQQLLDDTKSDSEWDCLVPLSGGRDSTFTLHQLVRKYKKRVLVYNYDNGFVEPIARKNIQHIADTLGVKVVYRQSASDIQCQNVKWLTKLNVRKSPGHVQAYLCSGCRNGIWGGAYAVAEEYNIPLIIFGESAMESGGFKELLTPLFTPNTAEKLKFMVRFPLVTLQRKKIEQQLNEEFPLPPADSKIKKINLFDFEEWNENTILATIQDELSWQQKEGQSSWRFDCQIHALVNAMVYNLLGMTEKDELYSKMIREGTITRDEALQKITRSQQEIDTELEIAGKVLDRLQLDVSEKEKIVRFCSGRPKLKNTW